MTTFSTYMTQWLYGEDGYYSAYHPIGKKGDFYTPFSFKVFAIILAVAFGLRCA
jgi:SAM-dependent MidA family methyltransferase